MDGIDLVIFDCDGVLVDSETLSAEILLEELGALGVEADMRRFADEFLGRSFPTVAAAIRGSSQVEAPNDFEERYCSRLLATFEARLRPTVGLERALAMLGRPSCVATSSTPTRARRSLEICGLLDRFRDRIFTASEVARGKPAPDLFLYAAERMQVAPSRCLVIEDSAPGLAAAEAAGMRFLSFEGGSHFRPPVLARRAPPGIRAFREWPELFEIAPCLAGPERAVRV